MREELGSTEEDEEEKVRTVQVPLTLNISLMHLKLKDNEAALKMSSQVIEVDPANPKAYYRRAQDHSAMGSHQEPLLASARERLMEGNTMKNMVKPADTFKVESDG